MHVGWNLEPQLRQHRNQFADGVGPRYLCALRDEQGFEGLLDCLLRIEARVFEEHVWSGLPV